MSKDIKKLFDGRIKKFVGEPFCPRHPLTGALEWYKEDCTVMFPTWVKNTDICLSCDCTTLIDRSKFKSDIYKMNSEGETVLIQQKRGEG